LNEDTDDHVVKDLPVYEIFDSLSFRVLSEAKVQQPDYRDKYDHKNGCKEEKTHILDHIRPVPRRILILLLLSKD
jgi:hypothetical protein